MLHILTLNWQGKDKIKALKQSLLPALENIEYVWHIRDNGSTDGSQEEIISWDNAKVHLIKYPDNKSNYSQGMNFLFKEAAPKEDDFVLTLNNDVILQDTTSIQNMIQLLQEDNDVGMVGAKLNYTNTQNIQHCGVLFHRSNGLPYHYRANMVQAERDTQNRIFPIITGAVALTRTSIFSELKFNEKYFWAFEDCDFSMKVGHRLNKKVVYCGETNIWHEESASLKKNPVNKMFFNNNCKLFLDSWYKEIDVRLSHKYAQDDYNLYIPNKSAK